MYREANRSKLPPVRYFTESSRPPTFAAHVVSLTHLGIYFSELYWLHAQYRLEQQLRDAEQKIRLALVSCFVYGAGRWACEVLTLSLM